MFKPLLNSLFSTKPKEAKPDLALEQAKAQRAEQAANRLVFEALSSGWPIPQWEEIAKSEPERGKCEFWSQVCLDWADCVSAFLGHPYDVFISENFVLVSSIEKPESVTLVKWLERCNQHIIRFLGSIAANDLLGKCAVFLFKDEEAYYDYISHYYKEGTHAASGGIYLNHGYGHFAIPFKNYHSTECTVAHELTHALIGNSAMPLWLDEGLAQTCEEQLTGSTSFDIEEVKERIINYWNSNTIQDFWSGASFNLPDTPNLLSYHLSKALTYRLIQNREKFDLFATEAQASDGGEAALQQRFDFNLNDLAASFLGDDYDWSCTSRVP